MFDYNEFYKKQDANFLAHPDRHILVASLCRGSVADIGCCMGILADYYHGKYTGFDIAKSALDKAREVRRKDANFIEKDCSDLSTLNFNKYETFVFSEYLEHFEDDEKIIGPLLKYCKKGSRIVITTPNGDRIPDPSHLRALTIPQLRKRFAPYGRVRFYNWPGAKSQIVMTIDLGVDISDSFSLVMVVKNEALGLENAILSAIEHVDNIVIAIDDSTTDQTVEIAKRYADTIKMFTWKDDFAVARNFAHEGVETKWIMFLDGHEYIKACPNLDEMLKEDVDGLLCTIEMDNGSKFRNPRIYKNGIKFKGAIHEQQQCRTIKKYVEFIVKHDRLGSQSKDSSADRASQRIDMVPRIMGKLLKDDPSNTRAAFHLGLFYHGTKSFRKAMKYYKKYLKYSTCKSERWFVRFHMALIYLDTGHRFKAFWETTRADRESPGRWEIAKLRGIIAIALERYDPAIQYLVNSLDENTGDVTYRPWVRDNSSIFNMIGECHFNLGDNFKAHVAFNRAYELCENKDFKKLLKKRSDLLLKMSESK